MRRLMLVLTIVALTGCREEPRSTPAPVTMTTEALGHFCQMNLTEHPGPKAQIHLDGLPSPLFFGQVRDAIAYQRMPEQSHAIRAIYVSDMGRAPSWASPGVDNWVAAEKAHFVVDSLIAGGMGAPELVPFSDKAAAMAFMTANGGRLQRLSDIPDEAVLRPVEPEKDQDGNFIPPRSDTPSE